MPPSGKPLSPGSGGTSHDPAKRVKSYGENSMTPTISPGLLYHDAHAAIDWLCRAFGFEKRLVIPGRGNLIVHAHLTFGHGGVMLSSAENYAFPHLCRSPRTLGGAGTVELMVVVSDVDAHYARALAAGAEIVIAIEDKAYGGRSYACRDIEGYVWVFGSYDPWVGDEDV